MKSIACTWNLEFRNIHSQTLLLSSDFALLSEPPVKKHCLLSEASTLLMMSLYVEFSSSHYFNIFINENMTPNLRKSHPQHG